jgi:predicted dehydrogenase
LAKLRVGFVGCGGIANMHAGALAQIPDVEMVSFSDVDAGRASAFAEKWAAGAKAVFASFEEMYEAGGLDVVYITLPPFAHSNEVELAADRGIHYLIEKPIALDMESARRMVDVTAKAGVRSQVGFQFRFAEAVEAVKALLASGEAGDPGLFVGRYFCNSLHSPWWRDLTKSGGQVLEQVIHTLDMSRYLMGEPETVYSRMSNQFHRDVEGYTVEDVSSTVVTFAGGGIASIIGTNGAIPGKWLSYYDLVAANLTAHFTSPNAATLYLTGRGYESKREVTGERNCALAESLDLVEAIRTGRETRTPITEGAKSLELALAAVESARTGAEVKLS